MFFVRCDLCGMEFIAPHVLNVVSFFKKTGNDVTPIKAEKRYELCNDCYNLARSFMSKAENMTIDKLENELRKENRNDRS